VKIYVLPWLYYDICDFIIVYDLHMFDLTLIVFKINVNIYKKSIKRIW